MNANQKKITVTVGIPAYNEEANIINILKSIIRQNQEKFILERIIVISDGSTDDTDKLVREFTEQYPLVELAADGSRKGKPARLNQMYSMNCSDILVQFDADLSLEGNNVVNEMLRYFQDEEVAIVAGNGQPLPGQNVVEKITGASELLWYEARKDWRDGHNIYNNGGCAFALRKSFARMFQMPARTIGDQHFIYLFCIQQKKKFRFAKNAVVNYRTPATIKDFFIQAKRSLSERQIVSRFFDPSVAEEYNIPNFYKTRALFKMLRRRPLYASLAIFLQILLRIIPLREDPLHARGIWESIRSTKTLTPKI